jgi:Transglycosylase SLT domain
MPVSACASMGLRLFVRCCYTHRCLCILSFLVIVQFNAASIHPAQAAHHHPGAVLRSAKPASRSAHSADIRRKPISARPRVDAHRLRRPEAITPDIIRALHTAKKTVQADPFVLLAIAWKESRFDPLARNKHSSARGLLQFTTATWLTVIRDFGARHGLVRQAAAISTDREGQLSVTNPGQCRAILALRDDPELQVMMAAERLRQERGALEQQLGRSATPADLYVLHLLGPAGARNFLTQLEHKPESLSIDVVGHAADPNLGLFIRNGRRLSVVETYEDIRAALSEQATHHAALFASAG